MRLQAASGLRSGGDGVRNFLALALALAVCCLAPLGHAATTTYRYDELGRVTCVGKANGTSITYTYDAPGNRSQQAVTTAACPGVTLQAPIANNVSATVNANSSNNPIGLNITGGAASSVAVSAQASHGAATASATSITYTPTAGYSGADSFQYTASNASGTSAPATASITVAGSSSHVSPNPTWSDIAGSAGTGNNAASTITGISVTVTLQLTTVAPSGGGTFRYNKSGAGWIIWTSGATITVVNNDTLAFQVSRTTNGESLGGIKVVNQSDANAVLNQFNYDVIKGPPP